MTRNSSIIIAYFVFGLLAADSAVAQLVGDVSVEVTEDAGVYTYEYTVSNSILSSANISIFTLDVANGRSVVDGEYAIYGGRLLTSPDNWAGLYSPFRTMFDDSFNATGVEVFSAAMPTPTLTGSQHIAFLATTDALDPSACGHPDGDISAGETETFTITSLYAPGDQDFQFIDCSFLSDISGTIQGPTVPPGNLPPICDFEGDGVCDATDIDLLGAEVFASAQGRPGADGELGTGDDQQPDLYYDLTVDGVVDANDLSSFLASVNRLSGDLDLNGQVEFADFLVLSGNFGSEALWSGGDLDGSGLVEFADFLAFSNNFGVSPPAASSVPEPSASLLCGVMLCGLLPLRKRSRA